MSFQTHWYVFQLVKHYLMTYFSINQGLKTLIGQQVSVWIDECKLEIVILQFLEGFAVDEEKLKNWIVS